MKIIAQHRHHIDNGGVSIKVEDRGVREGVVLALSAEYYGYPAIKTEMRVDNLGSKWCREIGMMFFNVANAMDKIDWEARYNDTGIDTSR